MRNLTDMPTQSRRPVVNLRRAYFECRYGQLHVRTAFPSTGGFDERTPVVCLHESPRTSRSFAALLPALGVDRSVYACDTPGAGESDAPGAAPSIADYAAAIGDFMDALRLRETDLFGVGTGAAIAVELAITRGRAVRRLVLAAVPLGAAAAGAAEPRPVPAAADGSHLAREWQLSRSVRGAAEPLATFAAGFADELANGIHGAAAARATAAWRGAERLPLAAQRTLVLRPQGPWGESVAAAARLLPAGGTEEFPLDGPCLFVDAATVAPRIRAFLDR